MSAILNFCTPACCCPKSCVGKAGSLRNRACGDWRIIPALVALAVSVTFLVVTLIWNYHYFAILPGVGVLASLYNVSLACDYKDLKTFAESNEKLTTQVSTLGNEVRTLHTENGKLKDQVRDLEGIRTKLEGVAKKLVEDREAGVKKITALFESVEKQGNETFNKLGGGLVVFKDLLTFLQNENTALNALSGETVSSVAALQKAVSAQADAMKKALESRAEASQLLQQVSALHKQELEKTEKVSQLQAKAELLGPLVGRLEDMQTRMENALEDIGTRATQIGTTKDDLEQLHLAQKSLNRQWAQDMLTFRQQLAKACPSVVIPTRATQITSPTKRRAVAKTTI